MRKKLEYFLLIAFSLVLASCSSDDEELIGNWSKVSSFGGRPTRGGASYFVMNDLAYVGLGYNSQSKKLTDMWVYDAAKDSWDALDSLPLGVRGRSHATAFAIDGKAYICGGRTFNAEERVEYLNEVWMFDPSKSKGSMWTQMKNFPFLARADAFGGAVSGKGYMGGGQDADGTFRDFYEYDPNSDTWTKADDVFGSKRAGAFCFVMDDKLYVGSGIDNGSYLRDFGYYDPAQGRWIDRRKIWNSTDESFDDDYKDIPRAFGVAFVLNGKAYITTGGTSSTWEYDPLTDWWKQRTSFEASGGASRIDAVAFTVYNSRQQKIMPYVGTGSAGTTSSTRYDDMWTFDPTAEQDDRVNY